MIFQTIPEWALKSQGDMRKRQKPMKSWPEKFQRNFCSTTLVCLHFLPSIIKSYISKTLVIPSKRKKWGQKSKRKKSRLLCHFQKSSLVNLKILVSAHAQPTEAHIKLHLEQKVATLTTCKWIFGKFSLYSQTVTRKWIDWLQNVFFGKNSQGHMG